MKVTYSLYLYPRQKGNGKYDLTIRRTQNRKHKYIKLGVELEKKQWNKRNRLIVGRGDADELNLKFAHKLVAIKKEDGICDVTGEETVTSYIRERMKILTLQGRIATKKRYNTALRHLTACFGRNLKFYELNNAAIERYKGYLRQQIKSRGHQPSNKTINNYLLTIGTIMNEAKKDNKHFGENPVSPEMLLNVGKSIPRNLTTADLWLINNLQISSQAHTRFTFNAINVFLYSFWSNGLRIGDALTLRWSNLSKRGIEMSARKNGKSQIVPYNIHNIQILRWYLDYEKEYEIFDWAKKKFIWETEALDDPSLQHPMTMLDREFFDALKQVSEGYKEVLNDTPGYNQFMHTEFDTWMKTKDMVPKTLIKELSKAVRVRNEYILDEIFNKIHRSNKRNDFIFPYLRVIKDEKDARKVFNKISSSTANINKQLKKLADKIGVPHFCTHWNRHSLGNQCAEEEISPYAVKEMFMHSSMAQSEEYMGRFAVNTKRVYDQLTEKLFGGQIL